MPGKTGWGLPCSVELAADSPDGKSRTLATTRNMCFLRGAVAWAGLLRLAKTKMEVDAVCHWRAPKMGIRNGIDALDPVHEVIATRSGSPEGPFLELMFVAKDI